MKPRGIPPAPRPPSLAPPNPPTPRISPRPTAPSLQETPSAAASSNPPRRTDDPSAGTLRSRFAARSAPAETHRESPAAHEPTPDETESDQNVSTSKAD